MNNPCTCNNLPLRFAVLPYTSYDKHNVFSFTHKVTGHLIYTVKTIIWVRCWWSPREVLTLIPNPVPSSFMKNETGRLDDKTKFYKSELVQNFHYIIIIKISSNVLFTYISRDPLTCG